MKHRFDAVLLVAAVLLSAAAVFVLVHDLMPAEGSPEAVATEVARLIRERAVVQQDDGVLALAAANGMATALDPYSAAWSATEYQHESQRTAGHYAGIGVMLGETSRGLTVFEIIAGGPASSSTLAPLDVISSIDGVVVPSVRPLVHVRGRLAGPAGTQVLLQVRRHADNSESSITLTRGSVDQPSAYGAMLDAENGLGVLVIESFFLNTAQQARAAVDAMLAQGLKGLVLDLRDNPGGVLDAGADVARLFLGNEVLIVQTIGRSGSRELRAALEAPFATLPLVVLVDKRSASASEVVAAALQDHARAPLLGERTYGKGVVQQITALRSLPGAALRLTTAHHYAPSGRCIEKSIGLDPQAAGRGGLVPDVGLVLDAAAQVSADALRLSWRYTAAVRAELQQETPMQDAQLDAALDILRGKPPQDRKL